MYRERVLEGDGEADAHIALAGSLDLLVDPDDLPLHVEQWTAGVSWIDRGIGLNHVADQVLRLAWPYAAK